MMRERGIEVDHSNIYRWVQKFTPKLEAAFRSSVGKSWRADESVLQLSCIKDEGRPLEAAIQVEASNHHKRH
jgi:transposase-like protein